MRCCVLAAVVAAALVVPRNTAAWVSAHSRRAGSTRAAKHTSQAAAEDARADSSNADGQGTLFDQLAEAFGVQTCVSLRDVGGTRGLVTNRDVSAGEDVMVIPASLCLWSNRDGVVGGLLGQTDLCWDQAGDLRQPVDDDSYARGLTWDVRLALALQEATCDISVGGQFWNLYGRLLPAPHEVTVPFCLPAVLLKELQHQQMAQRAQAQKDRLKNLFPLMMQTHMSHPRTACYAELGPNVVSSMPFSIQWAFALVRSRAFSAGADQFGFVPFLDMANHNFRPNANFTFDSTIDSFRLTALADVPADSEVCISYGQQLDDGKLAAQYGFCVHSDASPNAPQLADLPTTGVPVMSAADVLAFEGLLRGAAGAHYKKLGATSSRIPQHYTSVSAALSQLAARTHAHPPTASAQLLSSMEQYAKAEFPTSLAEDAALQARIAEALQSGRAIDERFLFALEYRMRRKDTHALASDLLRHVLGKLPA